MSVPQLFLKLDGNIERRRRGRLGWQCQEFACPTPPDVAGMYYVVLLPFIRHFRHGSRVVHNKL